MIFGQNVRCWRKCHFSRLLFTCGSSIFR